MHTAKASQKQMRLRSPLGQGQEVSSEYRHTIDAHSMPLGKHPKQADGEKDESDLGDLDDEDDSRTLFH